jgi:hypothetical protein
MIKREVLVIDNGPLRQHSFQAAQKIIEKIERLEEKIRRFHSSDQKLFNEWLELTFRSHRARHEKAQSRYIELARFHNWVVATSKKLRIEMHHAYRLMCEEQIRWNNGDEAQRRQIDQDRAEREAFIREQSRSRYSGDFEFDSDSEDPMGEDFNGIGEILSQVEEIIFGEDCEFLETKEERIERLVNMSDEATEMYVAMHDTGFMLFDIAMGWGETRGDYTLFKRIWSAMKPAHKNYFAKVYASMTEAPIEDLLQYLGIPGEWDHETKEESEEDEDGEAFSFDDSEGGRPARVEKVQRQAAANEDKLKQVFRKLMRKLHPDVHASASEGGQLPPWARRMWASVQKAYSDKNVCVLERLLKLTQLRMNALDELSISEIAEAKHWLLKDLEDLEDESQDLRNSLAWGFSGKKKYDSLKKRIESDFNRNLRIVMEEIGELEEQNKLLEILAERSYKPQRPNQYLRKGRSGKR